MSSTIIKSASVKVMLSYNYNHFESSMQLENESGISVQEIDEARKNCNRLCDKAVKQYQLAKKHESNRANSLSEKAMLEREVAQIKEKDKSLWTVVEMAKVKALEDHNWDLKWNYDEMYDDEY